MNLVHNTRLVSLTNLVLFLTSEGLILANLFEGNGASTIRIDGYCSNIDSLRSTIRGKWSSYEFVLDDCLVKRFLIEIARASSSRFGDVSHSEIDLHELIRELESTAARTLRLNRDRVDHLIQKSVKKRGSSMMRNEILLKRESRQLNHEKKVIRNLIEASKIRATLLSSEINALMDRCKFESLTAYVDQTLKRSLHSESKPYSDKELNVTHSDAQCFKSFSEVENELSDLCRRLRAQIKLLKVQILNMELANERFKELSDF